MRIGTTRLSLSSLLPLVAASAAITLAAMVSPAAQAQTLLEYSFTGNTTTGLNPTTMATNVTGTSLFTTTPGTGNTSALVLGTTTASDVFQSTGFYASSPYLVAQKASGTVPSTDAISVAGGYFFGITIQANAGYTDTLTSLVFSSAQGGGTAGQRGFDVRSSATGDNYATTLLTTTETSVRPTLSTFTIPLSGANFTNISSTTPTTFRFYIIVPGLTQSVDFDDITVNGTAQLATSSAPEPSALVLAGLPILFGAGARLRRRK